MYADFAPNLPHPLIARESLRAADMKIANFARPAGERRKRSPRRDRRAATACLQPALRDPRAVAGSFSRQASACFRWS